MSHKLQYPSFSVVFIQTFSIPHVLEFIQPDLFDAEKEKGRDRERRKEFTRNLELADAQRTPIAWMNRGSIEDQIFILPKNSPHEKLRLKWWQIFSKLGWRRQPIPGNLQRYSLRGFDFKMVIRLNKKKPQDAVNLQGHCSVEMNLFYGHLASFTYRFLFESGVCTMTHPLETDHIIAFLSTWLNGEFWSKDNDEDEATIDLYADFDVERIWLGENGEPLDEPISIDINARDVGRSFNRVAVRYKRFIYNYCTRYRHWYHFLENHRFKKFLADYPVSVEEDSHYAMVDVGGEDICHPTPWGFNLFDSNRICHMSEAEIREHIRLEHKAELMGLLTLYPKEWPYRDPVDFDEVCGGNIAIDTDDLVLVGSSVCLVVGTYVDRDDESGGVGWDEVSEERTRYHVYWPEYLMILQMVLARKYVLDYVSDQLVFSTLEWERRSPERMLKTNADLSVHLMRLLAQLDVLKMAKFPSHKVMYDRTCKRLGIAEAQERTNTLIENLDSGLNNIKDHHTARRETMMNIILGIVSVLSAFQLFYMTETKLQFWNVLGHKSASNTETEWAGAVIIFAVAAVAALVLLAIGITAIYHLINRFRR